MNDWTRRGLTGAGLGLIAGVAAAQTPPPPQGLSSDDLRRGRMTVPVHINGEGPYVFAIDTAANASVIADDLADALALQPDGDIVMHTLIAGETVGTVRAPRLQTGALDAADTRLALASRFGLDGLDGLIGTDLLAELRLELNFRGPRRMRVSRSRQLGNRFLDARRPTTRLMRAVEQRFGGLLMFEVTAGGAPAHAILDTGAQVSIANSALARATRASPIALRDGSTQSRVQSPTGRSAGAQPMMMPGLRFGGLSMGRVPVLVGDFHTFDLWDLAQRPALLMGVDVLELFSSVAIDLKRGEVVFEV